MKKRSCRARYGAGWTWKFADGRILDIGASIADEGPGTSGVSMYPWCLDRYERALKLKPVDSWILRRLIKHCWEHRQAAYISIRKTCEFEGLASRTTAHAALRRLEKLGYICRASIGGDVADRRIRYDVSGLYAALALCVAGDASSRWAQNNGGPLSEAEIRHSSHVFQRDDGQQLKVLFDIDFDALRRLANRRRSEADDEAENEDEAISAAS